MTGQPDALIVTAACWTAVAVAGYLACRLVRTKRAPMAAGAALVAIGVAAGGVASADSPHPAPPGRPSLNWATPTHEARLSAIVVRPGDCLWSITARRLRDPSPAQVAARWPDWWHVNRRVIGPDPNLIRPGQRLRPPDHATRRH